MYLKATLQKLSLECLWNDSQERNFHQFWRRIIRATSKEQELNQPSFFLGVKREDEIKKKKKNMNQEKVGKKGIPFGFTGILHHKSQSRLVLSCLVATLHCIALHLLCCHSKSFHWLDSFRSKDCSQERGLEDAFKCTVQWLRILSYPRSRRVLAFDSWSVASSFLLPSQSFFSLEYSSWNSRSFFSRPASVLSFLFSASASQFLVLPPLVLFSKNSTNQLYIAWVLLDNSFFFIVILFSCYCWLLNPSSVWRHLSTKTLLLFFRSRYCCGIEIERIKGLKTRRDSKSSSSPPVTVSNQFLFFSPSQGILFIRLWIQLNLERDLERQWFSDDGLMHHSIITIKRDRKRAENWIDSHIYWWGWGR